MPAERHALPLSQSVQSPDPLGRGAAGTAEDRGADLHPGDPDQDGGALHAGRTAGEDPGVGRDRGRRLHAHLNPFAKQRVFAQLATRVARARVIVPDVSSWSTRSCERPPAAPPCDCAGAMRCGANRRSRF